MLAQLITVAAGLAWLLVVVAAINVYRTTRAYPAETPPPGNSNWYLVMQGALWLAFLLMLTQSVLAWSKHGGLTGPEAVATVCFAIGFAVTCAGLAITVVRWRRAKRATRALE